MSPQEQQAYIDRLRALPADENVFVPVAQLIELLEQVRAIPAMRDRMAQLYEAVLRLESATTPHTQN
jgi:hypothetical protein